MINLNPYRPVCANSHIDIFDDCISRKVVLDFINEVCFSREQKWVDFRVSQGNNGQRDLIIKFIESLSSVQPKTGHWINGDSICPCCGEDKFKDLVADIWSDWQPKYCPNCGTKMLPTGLQFGDQDTLMSAT